jgi:hypothetical protein
MKTSAVLSTRTHRSGHNGNGNGKHQAENFSLASQHGSVDSPVSVQAKERQRQFVTRSNDPQTPLPKRNTVPRRNSPAAHYRGATRFAPFRRGSVSNGENEMKKKHTKASAAVRRTKGGRESMVQQGCRFAEKEYAFERLVPAFSWSEPDNTLGCIVVDGEHLVPLRIFSNGTARLYDGKAHIGTQKSVERLRELEGKGVEVAKHQGYSDWQEIVKAYSEYEKHDPEKRWVAECRKQRLTAIEHTLYCVNHRHKLKGLAIARNGQIKRLDDDKWSDVTLAESFRLYSDDFTEGEVDYGDAYERWLKLVQGQLFTAQGNAAPRADLNELGEKLSVIKRFGHEVIGYESRNGMINGLKFYNGKVYRSIEYRDALRWWAQLEEVGGRFNLDEEHEAWALAKFLNDLDMVIGAHSRK